VSRGENKSLLSGKHLAPCDDEDYDDNNDDDNDDDNKDNYDDN